MSESPEDPKKTIRLAVDNAGKVKKPKKEKPAGGGGPPGAGFYGPIDYLPDDCPVKALGTNGDWCFFLDPLGQLIKKKGPELGRLGIIKLFGGETYLKKTWPEVDRFGNPKNRWRHDMLAGILIAECHKKGRWDPFENVRELGCWVEDDGALIMHCGDVLYVGKERHGTGLRGNLLYPRCARTLEPVFASGSGEDGPAMKLLKKARSWNWTRGERDARLFVGLIGCQILGAAAPWRAQCWVTGPSSAGKSTLQLFIRWLHGPHGMIQAENATTAGIAQAVGNSSLPVSLDELETKPGNFAQIQEIIELMRIAASGGSRMRGGADGTPSKTQLFNCFLASSIVVPSLRQQDKSRLAILNLRRYVKPEREPGEDAEEAPAEDVEQHFVLGRRDVWERIGCQLRGRIIEQWRRYQKTLRAFRLALMKHGHDDRAADQFGAIGAAFDCLMYDGFDPVRAEEWGEMFPRDVLEETARASEERKCLDHLLEYMPDLFRGGAKQNVAYWVLAAKDEILADNGNGEAMQTLAKLGLRVYRGTSSFEAVRKTKASGIAVDPDKYQFLLDISHTAAPLRKIFEGTQWSGLPGSDGSWADLFKRLPYALFGRDRKRRIGGVLHYTTTLPFETVFPGMEEGEEDDIAEADRSTEAKRAAKQARARDDS